MALNIQKRRFPARAEDPGPLDLGTWAATRPPSLGGARTIEGATDRGGTLHEAPNMFLNGALSRALSGGAFAAQA
jgi:hypothetical protein